MISTLSCKKSVYCPKVCGDQILFYKIRQLEELKGFYGNLISYCLVIPFLIFVNLYTSPKYLWFWWAALGWGIGLASHAFQTFGIGRNWEERKIQEIMNQNNSPK